MNERIINELFKEIADKGNLKSRITPEQWNKAINSTALNNFFYNWTSAKIRVLLLYVKRLLKIYYRSLMSAHIFSKP
jgi:hypothetical protein